MNEETKAAQDKVLGIFADAANTAKAESLLTEWPELAEALSELKTAADAEGKDEGEDE
jgi:hypothetical protein